MKLYFAAGACSMAPHIVLREAAYTFDLESVDLAKKQTASGEDYTRINPKRLCACPQARQWGGPDRGGGCTPVPRRSEARVWVSTQNGDDGALPLDGMVELRVLGDPQAVRPTFQPQDHGGMESTSVRSARSAVRLSD